LSIRQTAAVYGGGAAGKVQPPIFEAEHVPAAFEAGARDAAFGLAAGGAVSEEINLAEK
jgi:hypothetical protein